MNICLLNDSFPPLIDGVANTVINYAENLVSRGDNVTVAVPQYPGVVDDYDYGVIRYPSFDTTKLVGYRAGYPFTGFALDSVKEFKPDIYHSHCPAASTFMARTFRESIPAPVVFTYHLGFHGEYRVMNNGVDFEKGRPSSEKVISLRKKYSLEDGIPVFLFVGRIMWYKGLRIVLDALTALKEAGIDFRFLCVGDGQDKKEVISYSKKCRIEEKCIFVDAIHDRDELRTYYGASDLFLFLSDFDTNGIVVREAAACGLGSMLLNGSAAAEGVTSFKNGILVEEKPASAAAMLTRLCYEPELMKKIGENAMNDLYFSWKDSVAVARTRYEVIVDDYKSGRYSLKHQAADSFFGFTAELNSVFERGKDLFNR